MRLANVHDFKIADVQLQTEADEWIELHECKSVELAGIQGASKEGGQQLAVYGTRSSDIVLRRSAADSLTIYTGEGVSENAVKRIPL